MPRELSWFPTLALIAACVALPAPALSQTVVVPDDYPTIQAAIDGGAEVIRIRDGLVPERLTIRQKVTLEAGPAPMYLGNWAPVPMIQSLTVERCREGDCQPGFNARGIRFLGEVRMDTGWDRYSFESCRFDSGLTDLSAFGFAGRDVSVRNCMIFGNARVAGAVQFAGNTVMGGKVEIHTDGSHRVDHNTILGPAEAGLELWLSDSKGSVSMNTIRGTVDGIKVMIDGGYLTNNDISDCSGDGIVYAALRSTLNAYCESNRISNCGGAGVALRTSGHDPFSFYASISLTGNSIERTGAAGVLFPSGEARALSGNTILDAGGDGVRVDIARNAAGNVIGRSRGAGLRVLRYGGPINRNTFFSNVEAGIDVHQLAPTDSVSGNISAFNGEVGFRLRNGWLPRLAFNDWFGNVIAPTDGIAPGASDLEVNPLFCDLGSGNVHLPAGSPLLGVEGAPQIGALGEGCGGTTGVGERRPREIGGFGAWPTPARRSVMFSIPTSEHAVEVEVYDVTGARRWSTTYEAGTSEASWGGTESNGRRAEPGVYFARIRSNGVDLGRTRIVMTE